MLDPILGLVAAEVSTLCAVLGLVLVRRTHVTEVDKKSVTVADVLEALETDRQQRRGKARIHEAVLAQILFTLDRIEAKETEQMATLAEFIPAQQAQQTKLLENIAKQTTLIDGAVTLIKGYAARDAAQLQQIKDLTEQIAAGGVTPEQQKLLDDLVAGAEQANVSDEAGLKKLEDALLESTPQADERRRK